LGELQVLGRHHYVHIFHTEYPLNTVLSRQHIAFVDRCTHVSSITPYTIADATSSTYVTLVLMVFLAPRSYGRSPADARASSALAPASPWPPHAAPSGPGCIRGAGAPAAGLRRPRGPRSRASPLRETDQCRLGHGVGGRRGPGNALASKSCPENSSVGD